MASGDLVVEIIQANPPGANFAALTKIVGASTPAEGLLAWAFDAATIEYMDYLVRINEAYAGGGITLTIYWSAATATSNACRWSAAFRRIADDAEDLDTTAQTYDFNDVDCTAPSAAGEISVDTLSFTSGADMDSIAAGELGILRIRRNASHANDNMTGDANLITVIGRET